MTFSLTIDCDNAAFEDDYDAEIARLLREVADRLTDGNEDEGRIRDSNGNQVGTFGHSTRIWRRRHA